MHELIKLVKEMPVARVHIPIGKCIPLVDGISGEQRDEIARGRECIGGVRRG